MENRTKTIKSFQGILKAINPDEYPDIKEMLSGVQKYFEACNRIFIPIRQYVASIPQYFKELNLITDEQFIKELNLSKSEIDEILKCGDDEDFDKILNLSITIHQYRLSKTHFFSRERRKISVLLKAAKDTKKDVDTFFNLIIQDVNAINKKIQLTKIRKGDLSACEELCNLPILLGKDEKCYITVDGVELYEDRAVRDTAGSYDGFSFRVAKGVSYRVGGFSARGESHMEKRLIDRGTFYVTNKRYIFDGSSKNIEGELRKVISVEAYSDGIKISRTNKRDEVFAGNMDGEYIGAVISGIVKNIR